MIASLVIIEVETITARAHLCDVTIFLVVHNTDSSGFYLLYSEEFMVSPNAHSMIIAKLKLDSFCIGSVEVVNIGLA
jgi:hypothetical protein